VSLKYFPAIVTGVAGSHKADSIENALIDSLIGSHYETGIDAGTEAAV
jgi:hypothetical protein